ncbi:MAG: type VI secretion system baseplate subunit TssK [Desulfobacteraceae bacterium]
MNKAAKPILWNQGLFLQPHHFQQFDTYLKSLTVPFHQYQTPYFWGCNRLEISESALSARVLEVDRCELIFPDGTWVQYPGNAGLQARSFEDISFDVEGDEPVTVYVGIRKWEGHKNNVTSLAPSQTAGSAGTRFVSSEKPEEVADTHEGGEPAGIRKMEHVLRIFWDHEIEKYTEYLVLPVARLKLENDRVVFAKDFVPPVYLLSGSDELLEILKKLREMMISRCRVFESYKLSHGFQSSDFDAHFLPHLLVLNALNRALPALNHMIEIPCVHPQAVYQLLRQVIGEMSTFSDRINALGQLKDGTPLLPEYDHEKLFTCFSEAQVLIGELLNAISIGGESIITMIREGDFFTARISPEEFRDSYMYYIVVKTQGDSDQVVNDFHNLVKVANQEDINSMISRALPGVPVKHRLVPPPGMPKRSDSFFFRIDSKHLQWEGVKRSGNICLHWDNAPEDAAIEIIVSQT